MKSNTLMPETEPFDREYGLAELLARSILEKLFGEFVQAISIRILVLTSDGSVYFSQGSLSRGEIELAQSLISRKQVDNSESTNERQDVAIIPLNHEFEPVGYVVFYNSSNNSKENLPILPLERFVVKTLEQLLWQNYKYQMAAGLHGQVVEESYAQLKNKNALLEKSEEKYRLLAENLEIEVEKKTKQIQQVQAQFIQQEKMVSIGQLAAGVAHEINNPMGFISCNLNTLLEYTEDIRLLIEQFQGFCSELKSNIPAEDDRTETFKQLEQIDAFIDEKDIDFVIRDIPVMISESREGADRIKKIVIDLKDFAHPGEQDPEYIDLNRCLDSTLNIVWNEIKYKAKVVKDYGALPRLRCYPQKIGQIFMNLLMNAAQAIENKGEINISTKVVGEKIVIATSDTGSGIAEENLSKIFDPFFTTKPAGTGTGLGLNVVYNVVNQHNGRIEVQSKVGRGTTFIIELPIDSLAKAGTDQCAL